MAPTEPETLTISDGTTVQISRVPGLDDATWAEVKAYVEGSPATAKALRKFGKDPDAMRGWLRTQAVAEHYSQKVVGGDAAVLDRIKALESDPELAPVLEDIRKGGLEAAMKLYGGKALMLKFSKKVDGVPGESHSIARKADEAPMTLHEAAQHGDLPAVEEYLAAQAPLGVQDYKGVTPLGYAIGANRVAVVKLLMDNRANPYAVDAAGNAALHYAAGYGRKELVEYLLQTGAPINQTNAQGQSPLAVATLNRQERVIEVLQAHGAA